MQELHESHSLYLILKSEEIDVLLKHYYNKNQLTKNDVSRIKSLEDAKKRIGDENKSNI